MISTLLFHTKKWSLPINNHTKISHYKSKKPEITSAYDFRSILSPFSLLSRHYSFIELCTLDKYPHRYQRYQRYKVVEVGSGERSFEYEDLDAPLFSREYLPYVLIGEIAV